MAPSERSVLLSLPVTDDDEYSGVAPVSAPTSRSAFRVIAVWTTLACTFAATSVVGFQHSRGGAGAASASSERPIVSSVASSAVAVTGGATTLEEESARVQRAARNTALQ